MTGGQVDWIEAAGYLASALVFLTFYMKTLIPLRLMAIASNVIFIIYALGSGIMPVLLLHAALLPLNAWRTYEQIATYRMLRASARERIVIDALIPFMTRIPPPKDGVLFRMGDRADRIYYIASGAVVLPELGKTLEAGTLFGEIGLFTPEHRRTASAICEPATKLLSISESDILHHCMKEPAFGLFLTRLIAGRMAENQQARHAEDLRQSPAPRQSPDQPPAAPQ